MNWNNFGLSVPTFNLQIILQDHNLKFSLKKTLMNMHSLI